jgi:hypothetical protein
VKVFYIKIYIFFYFYQKKYINLKATTLGHLLLYNKKLYKKKSPKKNIFKIIKFFFLKKTLTVKKIFLLFKKKNIKFFKFIIFINKNYKLVLTEEGVLARRKKLKEIEAKKEVLKKTIDKIRAVRGLTGPFVIKKLSKKKSLLYLFLVNKLLFIKKKRIRKKKFLKLKHIFTLRKRKGKYNYMKGYLNYKNNAFIHLIRKKS